MLLIEYLADHGLPACSRASSSRHGPTSSANPAGWSIERTTAWAGGSTQRPVKSLSFSGHFGSLDSLNAQDAMPRELGGLDTLNKQRPIIGREVIIITSSATKLASFYGIGIDRSHTFLNAIVYDWAAFSHDLCTKLATNEYITTFWGFAAYSNNLNEREL